MNKFRLENRINVLNDRCNSGLNTDDQLKAVVQLDRKTKGWSFIPTYDDYALISDYDKLKLYIEKYGLKYEAYHRFNVILIQKGGNDYREELIARLMQDRLI